MISKLYDNVQMLIFSQNHQTMLPALNAYERSILIEPSPIPWNVLPPGGNFIFDPQKKRPDPAPNWQSIATSRDDHRRATIFYTRLQMFVCTPCSSIYAFDTGDMLVTRPFLHTLPAYKCDACPRVPLACPRTLQFAHTSCV